MMRNYLRLSLNKSKVNVTILFLFLFTTLSIANTYGQNKTLSGVVTDEIGSPLPGVTVIETGTLNGVSTDFDGKYTIKVKIDATLTFSYLGYKSVIRIVGKQNIINVSLNPDSEALDEVVVVGYGSVKKKDVTGSVASLKIDELREAPVANFDEALAGRITGLRVSSTGGGGPGSAKKIVIRGSNSLTQSSDPLYVVDGFIVSNFDPGQIDPSDIESMTVLKDASATAIYGANGSNGVIIITSKKAKLGKTTISFETRLDVKNVSKKLDVLNSYDYILLQDELDTASAQLSFLRLPNPDGGDSIEVPGASYEDYKDVPARNWQDEAFRAAFSKTHRLKISNGTEKTRVRVSLNSVEDEGTLIKSLYKRIDGRMILNHKVNDQFDVSADVNYQNYVQEGLNVSGTSQYSFLRSLLTYRPVVNKYRDFGGFNPLDDVSEDLGDFTNIVVWHPIVSLRNEFRRRETDRFTANIGLKYKLSPSLTLETKNSYHTSTRKIEEFNNSKTVYGRLINPINGINAGIRHDKWKNFSTVNTLRYKKKFEEHSIEAMAGITLNVRNTETSTFASFFIPEYLQELGVNAIGEGTPNPASDGYSSGTNKLFSLLGRLNYSYRDKYLLTTSVRRDASSRFADGKRSGIFPSLAFAWQANKEDFINDLNIFSQLKFKAGYGQTGNERVSNNAIYSLYTGSGSDYFFNGAVVPGQRPSSAAGNPNLRWEITEQVNFGVDMGFLKDRISLEVEAYQKDTKDLLISADAAYTQGTSTRWINLGQIRNKGLEFNLNTINIDTEDFKWSSNFNISFNQNTVVELPDGNSRFYRPNYYQHLRSNQYIIEEGKALGNMFGYLSDGVYQIDDFVNYDREASTHTLKSTEPNYGNHQPGDEKFKDLNGDGVITQADKTIIGNGLAKHFGGFSNTFKYKNFELGAFFQWNYGNDILNASRIVLAAAQNRGANQLTSVLDRWTHDNQDTDVHRAGGQGFQDVSSRIVEDGSYIRLKTINVSYTFPQDLMKKLNLSSLKLYLAAQNLATWTNYSGYDPDVSVVNSALAPGIDYSSYPKHKTVSFGLNVTF